jgi:hypothetical protein
MIDYAHILVYLSRLSLAFYLSQQRLTFRVYLAAH